MGLVTVGECARALRVTTRRIRESIRDGTLATSMVGGHVLVDLDEAGVALSMELNGAKMDAVMMAIGLSERSIRRGIAAGWLPAVKTRGGYRFDLGAVRQAVDERLR